MIRIKISGGSEMNFISNLTCGELFLIIIGGFIILVMLEWFRRETMSWPWPKVAVRWMFVMIGGMITMRGLSEFYLRRWMGIVWILIGTGIVYMADRERIEYLRQKRAEKAQRRD